MEIINYKEKKPVIHCSAFIASGAKIIGDVTIGVDSSIWFNSVLRADVAKINIGNYTNIQDGTIIHTSRNQGPTVIGDYVTVGHKAMIHACTIHDEAFIGMNATILDFAVIERNGFVAAGALIPPGKVVKSGELWAGVPARFLRNLTIDEIKYIKISSENYVQLAKDYK